MFSFTRFLVWVDCILNRIRWLFLIFTSDRLPFSLWRLTCQLKALLGGVGGVMTMRIVQSSQIITIPEFRFSAMYSFPNIHLVLWGSKEFPATSNLAIFVALVSSHERRTERKKWLTTDLLLFNESTGVQTKFPRKEPVFFVACCFWAQLVLFMPLMTLNTL